MQSYHNLQSHSLFSCWLQHTTYSITIWFLVSKCLWAAPHCNSEETNETLSRSCLIQYRLWKIDQGFNTCMLSYNKTAMGIVSTAISRDGVELGPPSPSKTHFFLWGSSWQQDGLFHRVLDFPSSRCKTQHCGLYTLEYFVVLFCVPVQPLWLMELTVCKPCGIWLGPVSREATAETRLKCLSIQPCFINYYKDYKCMFQYMFFFKETTF